MAINLLFRPGVRVGGEVLYGEVELHFPQVQDDGIEEVHVKLRGSVLAAVARQFGDSYVERRERIHVVHENVSVWTRASAYPPPELNVLRIPFKFQLPLDVHPSAHYRGPYRHGMVGYSIEAVGVRKGAFHFNRRNLQAFAVLPADEVGLRNRILLNAGWPGPWHVAEATKDIRRGLWGAYSKVKVQLKLPEIDALPLFTKIPITIHVLTTTKLMKRDDAEGDDTKGRIFPCPPLHPREVELCLRRRVPLNAKSWKAEGNEDVANLGGLGKAADVKSKDNEPADAPRKGNIKNVTVGSLKGAQIQAELQVGEKRWIPMEDDKQKGCWVQESTINTFVRLASTPSFNTPLMSIEYKLRLKVDFPGIRNGVETDIPVRLTSGMTAAPDPWAPSPPEGSISQDAPPYDGDPMLDLPPNYWTSTDFDGDNDKKGKGEKK